VRRKETTLTPQGDGQLYGSDVTLGLQRLVDHAT
jgi:hypothetical protein